MLVGYKDRHGSADYQTGSSPADHQSIDAPIAIDVGGSIAASDKFLLLAAGRVPSTTDAVHWYCRGSSAAWKYAGELRPRERRQDERFGASLSVDGATVVVGAPAKGAGSAYVFRLFEEGAAVQMARLAPSGEAANFGEAVAVSGTTALLAARSNERDRDGKGGIGAAYLFQADSSGRWREIAVLAPADVDALSCPNRSVALEGRTAVVGVHGHEPYTGSRGAVYVYSSAGEGPWRQVAKLTPDKGDGLSMFGKSLAICGDWLLVGAPLEHAHATNAGAVYVFHRDAAGIWRRADRLIGNANKAGGRFGWSLEFDGRRALIGAPGGGGPNGDAYIYAVDKSGFWWRLAIYKGSDAVDDRFGVTVALAGDLALVGAGKTASARRGAPGAVYQFPLSGYASTAPIGVDRPRRPAAGHRTL
jgi:hypothetical protein